jgi:hypothetical protein
LKVPQRVACVGQTLWIKKEQVATYAQAQRFSKSYPFPCDTKKHGLAHGLHHAKPMIYNNKNHLYKEWGLL